MIEDADWLKLSTAARPSGDTMSVAGTAHHITSTPRARRPPPPIPVGESSTKVADLNGFFSSYFIYIRGEIQASYTCGQFAPVVEAANSAF
jgi:hypothetical protein